MLRVKTYLDRSEIDGYGVFAGEDIPKGTVTWQFEYGFDLYVEEFMIKNDPEYIKKYAYFDKQVNKHILCGDIDKYTNHSLNPNVGPLSDGRVVALRDIKKGEEILVNYFDIDLYADQKNV